METDFITRKAAMAMPLANGQYDHEHANEHFILGLESYKEWLECVPAADVAPWEWLERFAEGRRIEYGAGMHWNYARDFVKEAKEAYKNGLVFCPSCGADMRGESDG